MGEEVSFYDFRDLIVPTRLKNEHSGIIENGKSGFVTNPDSVDKAYLFSSAERKALCCQTGFDEQDFEFPISDFAIANGTERRFFGGHQQSMKYWLRPGSQSIEDDIITHGGLGFWVDKVDYNDPSFNAGIVPAMNLDVQKIIQLKKKIPGFGEIKEAKDKNGKTLYHTISIGSWPEKLAPNTEELERIFYKDPESFIQTGKKFIDFDRKLVPWKLKYVICDYYYDYRVEYKPSASNLEYCFQGKFYVRTKNHRDYHVRTRNHYKEPMNIDSGFCLSRPYQYVWLEEKPKEWIIANYQDLPKPLNPHGTGKAEQMVVWAGEIMRSGINFSAPVSLHQNQTEKEPTYQDSVVRAYLNGEGQFRECNFLTESLVTPICGIKKEKERCAPVVVANSTFLDVRSSKKLSEFNREIFPGEVLLKQSGVDKDKPYQDLDKKINYIDEIKKHQNGYERGM